MTRWRPALPLLVLIMAGVAMLGSGALDRFNPSRLLADGGALHASIAAYPLVSRLSYVALLTLAIATGVPGTILISIAGGFLFGALQGSALSSVALVLGSLALYLATRLALRSGGRQPPELAIRLREGFAQHPVRYTFALRFVPVVPLGAMTVALAWLRCPLWLFLGATWLGGTVSLVIESYVGAGLGSALAAGEPLGAATLLDPRLWLPLCAFAIVSVLPLIVRSARARRGRD